jgi:hypothetical protein
VAQCIHGATNGPGTIHATMSANVTAGGHWASGKAGSSLYLPNDSKSQSAPPWTFAQDWLCVSCSEPHPALPQPLRVPSIQYLTPL